MKRIVVSFVIGVAVAAGLWAQTSIKTTGNIETAEQLVSTQATGMAPLAVSSTTLVANLNADLLDGNESTDFAGAAATAAELVDLQAQINALGLARVPRTGQTTCYNVAGLIRCAGTGQDGALQLGVTWPNPRFTDNGDGTVTDNLTGLIWLANANCAATVGGVTKADILEWGDALTWSNALAAGNCGLTDGSAAGAWRLPNVRELHSLVHYGAVAPAVPDTAGTGKCDGGTPCAFSGLVSSIYWSSSTFAFDTSDAYFVGMDYGYVFSGSKASGMYVWPVKRGQ